MEVMTNEVKVAPGDKYSLTVREAAAYFCIGIKKMRRLAEENVGDFVVFSGNKYIIKEIRTVSV